MPPPTSHLHLHSGADPMQDPAKKTNKADAILSSADVFVVNARRMSVKVTENH